MQRARGDAEADNPGVRVFEATETAFKADVPVQFRDSALEYELKLYNGVVARAVVYLVYSEPQRERDANGKKGLSDGRGYTWVPVMRQTCAKGCEGPILSAIQRFGKQGRTQKSAAQQDSAPVAKPQAEDKWKDTRNLFISIDEASNHVCTLGPNKCKTFRLLFGVFERDSQQLLGSGVSGPIRVLANNDVPKGAAAMRVRCGLSESWTGWEQNAMKNEEELREHFKAMCPPPPGKPSLDKARDRRSEDASQQTTRKPLQNNTNTVRQGAAGKRTAMPVPAQSKRAKMSGATKSKRNTVPVPYEALGFGFDPSMQEAMGMPAPESQDQDLPFNFIMGSPLGTPPDEQRTVPAFAGIFGTPEYLGAPEIMNDALNTSDLPNVCTPGAARTAAQDAMAMPPPTTGMGGAFRFTPALLPNITSSGSLPSLLGLDSLGTMTFGKTPADFRKKTESKVFTRSTRKVAATGEPTPTTQFLNSIFASAQAASTRRTTRSNSEAKPALQRDNADVLTDTEAKNASVRAEVEPSTAVAPAHGAEATDVAPQVAPARVARSLQVSPSGVAPVRLFFASPVGRGGEPLEGSDEEDDAIGFASPNARNTVSGANGLQSHNRRNTRNAQKIRLPRMASVPEIVDDAAEKANDRAAKAARLSGHFRPVKVPPPPKHVASDPESIKRKTRNLVHFSNDVNFENAPSTSKRCEMDEREALDVDNSLRSPGWPQRNRRAVNKHASGKDESSTPGFMAALKKSVNRTIGA